MASHGEEPMPVSKKETMMETFRSNFEVKSWWQEVSGSLGDIGTFLPLLLALSLVNGVSFGTTLIFTGLYNIVTGAMFGVPMPVQPMKSIAAVAITEGDPLTVPQIMAAGIEVASLLVFLGVTGLMTLVQKLVPLPLVRGIQLAQGIQFGMTATKYVIKNQNLRKGKSTTTRGWLGSDGLFLAFSAFLFIVMVTGTGSKAWAKRCGVVNPSPPSPPVKKEAVSFDEEEAVGGGDDVGGGDKTQLQLEEPKKKKSVEMRGKVLGVIPTALIVFLVGLVISILRKTSDLRGMKYGPPHVSAIHISSHDWKTGFTRAAIPQIPLSLLNSVVATCKLSRDLFPEKKIVTAHSVSISVGLMNLVGCWFGVMPVCHGCGGLAGQYRFGARTGMAPIILGAAKLVVGLVFGSSFIRVLAHFPIGLLGVLLFFSGLELAMTCRDQNSRFDAFNMLVVAIVILGTNNAAKGFVFGLIIWAVAKAHELYTENRPITDFFK